MGGSHPSAYNTIRLSDDHVHMLCWFACVLVVSDHLLACWESIKGSPSTTTLMSVLGLRTYPLDELISWWEGCDDRSRREHRRRDGNTPPLHQAVRI